MLRRGALLLVALLILPGTQGSSDGPNHLLREWTEDGIKKWIDADAKLQEIFHISAGLEGEYPSGNQLAWFFDTGSYEIKSGSIITSKDSNKNKRKIEADNKYVRSKLRLIVWERSGFRISRVGSDSPLLVPAPTEYRPEIRFFAGLKRFYKAGKHDTLIGNYSNKRWLRRLCVLKLYDKEYDGNATLSVYKARESGWKFWQLRKKKRPDSKRRKTSDFWRDYEDFTPDELKNIKLDGYTPIRVLTLGEMCKNEIKPLKEYTSESKKWKNHQIFVMGTDDGIRKIPCKAKGCKNGMVTCGGEQRYCKKCIGGFADKLMSYSESRCWFQCNYTPSQKWVLSVYHMDNKDGVVNAVNKMLVERDLVLETFRYSYPDRRRLSPGEKLLHDHRLTTPYRDSPVLTRLLKEIREANK